MFFEPIQESKMNIVTLKLSMNGDNMQEAQSLLSEKALSIVSADNHLTIKETIIEEAESDYLFTVIFEATPTPPPVDSQLLDSIPPPRPLQIPENMKNLGLEKVFEQMMKDDQNG